MRRKKQHAVKLAFQTLILLLLATPAHASMFHGETLDALANVLAWAVLVIVPAVGITVFWLLHVMPEKIAAKKHHPQTQAIHTLCLLSLFFGGLLWPIAWLWAYSKPVLYKMAYGTDQVPHGHEDSAHPAPDEDQAAELTRLRNRVAELESKKADRPMVEGRVA
jgi:CBS domain containing-hemolysin-like protein